MKVSEEQGDDFESKDDFEGSQNLKNDTKSRNKRASKAGSTEKMPKELTKLEKLFALYEKGAITKEEYEALKKKFL